MNSDTKTKSNTATGFSIWLVLTLLLLSACGGGDDTAPASSGPIDPDAKNRPVLAPIGYQVFVIDQTSTIKVSAEDPNGEELTYSVVENGNTVLTNSGSDFFPDTQEFVWTPSSDAGHLRDNYFFVTFVVTNAKGLSASETVYIDVVNSEEKLYRKHCARCHGLDAGGGTLDTNEDVPTLTGETIIDVDTIKLSIKDFPIMGDTLADLNDAELANIAAFIDSLVAG